MQENNCYFSTNRSILQLHCQKWNWSTLDLKKKEKKSEFLLSNNKTLKSMGETTKHYFQLTQRNLGGTARTGDLYISNIHKA